MKHFNDIEDNEIRIIGQPEVTRKPWYRRWWVWTIAASVMALLAVVLFLWTRYWSANPDATAKEAPVESIAVEPTVVQHAPATVLVYDTVVNDVPLRLYTPTNATPELCLGLPDTTDESIILALQAADIRADNHKIVGAFVLKGEPLSWGLSKQGFCAIFDGKMHIGMAENSPLFEEATEKGGYFFRQYPLVNQGAMVENKPKGKAHRHALCELDGKIVVVSSIDRESFHDFAQALADLGIENAVSLTGGLAWGYCRDNEEGIQSWGGDLKNWTSMPELNYILWRATR
ncbi:MAG: hypothetical protein IKU03_09615 [Bacteroidales bacterium]|nr:hypothetical protein [Bacteroidales bacterium]